MNKIEAARLAAAAHDLRPDWPKQSILTTLHPLVGMSYRDVAVAMADCYTDPDTQTPARLLERNARWWKTVRLPGNHYETPPMFGGLVVPVADPDKPAEFKSTPLVLVPPMTDDERERASSAKAAAVVELARVRAERGTK